MRTALAVLLVLAALALVVHSSSLLVCLSDDQVVISLKWQPGRSLERTLVFHRSY